MNSIINIYNQLVIQVLLYQHLYYTLIYTLFHKLIQIQSMKFMLTLLIVLLFSANAAISYDSSLNYISNADFSYPKLSSGQYNSFTTAGAWSEITNKIQIGDAKIWNKRWPSGQLCDLTSTRRSTIYQTITIDEGYYQLSITWAANQFATFADSKWSLYWNDVLVQSFVGSDYEIHKETLTVKAIQGINKVSLKSQSGSLNYGAGVKLVQLYAENNIQNGNFETPSTRKGWRILTSAGQSWSSYTNQIKIGQGTIFNSIWKTGQVAELDANQNSQIYQIVSIPAGKYHLRFDWAARTNIPFISNSFSVWWNNGGITFISPPDYLIHTFNTDVQASQGNNILSLRGEGISDGYGVDIDNVRLWRVV